MNLEKRAKESASVLKGVTTSELRSLIFFKPSFLSEVSWRYWLNLFLASRKAAARALWRAVLWSNRSKTMLETVTLTLARFVSRVLSRGGFPRVSLKDCVASEPSRVTGELE